MPLPGAIAAGLMAVRAVLVALEVKGVLRAVAVMVVARVAATGEATGVAATGVAKAGVAMVVTGRSSCHRRVDPHKNHSPPRSLPVHRP